MAKILLLILDIALIYAAVSSIQVLKYIAIGQKLAEDTIPFQKINPAGSPKILIMGDSTALGAGASPSQTVAGYFGADYPNAHIKNISKNGWKIKDLLDNLPDYAQDAFDLAIIQIGANDIIKFTPLKKIKTNLPILLRQAGLIAKNIVILHSGNIGTAPFFPLPAGWILTSRTKSVREIYKTIAKEKGATYVDLFEERENDIFLKNPSKYYAPDYLHLTGAGYKVWYDKIQAALQNSGIKL